nr:PREDICTED: uncharacterized protein LOC107398073 [Tribolium castaneum]|eukprot:XP_015836410.1 PREDICTED: uncharacterized protein LOC107398073 [Tribolium castaneum]
MDAFIALSIINVARGSFVTIRCDPWSIGKKRSRLVPARASSVPVLALECTVQSWAEVVTVTRETNRLPTGLLDVGASVTSNCCVVDDTDVFFMAAIRLWDEGREPFIWTSG